MAKIVTQMKCAPLRMWQTYASVFIETVKIGGRGTIHVRMGIGTLEPNALPPASAMCWPAHHSIRILGMISLVTN